MPRTIRMQQHFLATGSNTKTSWSGRRREFPRALCANRRNRIQFALAPNVHWSLSDLNAYLITRLISRRVCTESSTRYCIAQFPISRTSPPLINQLRC